MAASRASSARVRTGRASTALLDRVTVAAYGVRTPLNQVATIHAPEPRLITVQPFDRSLMHSVEKALQESELGLTPSNDGQMIRLPVPELTEERRKEMVRSCTRWPRRGGWPCATSAATCSTTSSGPRRTATSHATRLKGAQDDVQKVTDGEVKSIDAAMARKEAEILEV